VGIGPLLIAAALHAGDADLSALPAAELKARGEAAFTDGVRRRDDPEAARPFFRTAADCFEEIRRRGARNATLFRNLGNSYLLAGDLPHAVLSYRSGLRLDPGDRELAVGLQSARDRVDYPPDTTFGRPGPAGRGSWTARVRDEWLVAGAAVLYAGACVGLTRWLMRRRAVVLAAAVAALAGAAALTGLAVQGVAGSSGGPVVVVAEDGVLLRRGDGPSYPPRYDKPLNRGVEATLLTTRGGWVQVELSGGEAGWVLGKSVLVENVKGPPD
jgi:hypothetical protein